MTAAAGTGDRLHSLGRFRFACGRELERAELRYRCIGRLRDDGSNLVLVPSYYGGSAADLEWLVGPLLDPQRHCVLLVNSFGNGRSSSPGNSAMGLQEQGWRIHHSDNVRAQRRLLQEVFGLERVPLILGWSMGAQQAYQWAVQQPERVERLLCIGGTARTSPHNRLFLLSLRQALTTDPHWTGEGFTAEPLAGLRQFATIYASWAASQAFYRAGGHLQAGCDSVEEYVERFWLPLYRRHDPRNLIAMLDTWLAHDVSQWRHGGDLAAALAGIRARVMVVGCEQDLYFPPEDLAAEAERIPGARYRSFASVLGHRAGNPREAPEEQGQLREALEVLLAGW
ncbi:alpha/beta fold hydrolase [Synechococcus sp. RSCCF101]|uniref:alpha/beta fold hydrolase n=1 Tax=Synechococcus sp. RSCCF101 TaxID=2511069 RepID=UPI0012449B7F|nr:alpha/beta fold hydrolase [Synechococcus sp. RSCCF101]QEY31568.1 alpha/beta fold hydrolase [Synechococcus sp. RSCCF101]